MDGYTGADRGEQLRQRLDLTVGSSAGAFKGNVFAGGVSVPGGAADPRNNLEGVYLPAGSSGNFSVTVTAANIAGDGVPGAGDATDQDFALVVSNAVEVSGPALTGSGMTVSPVGGDSDSLVEPGERFAVTQSVQNVGTATATGIEGTLAGSSPVTITDGSAAWPALAPDADALKADPLTGPVDPRATCGAPTTVTLDITSSQGSSLTRSVTISPREGVNSPNRADVPKAIPDNTGTGASSTLTVPGSDTIQDVNVRLGSLTHTWDGDLKIQLRSPAGTIVVLAFKPQNTDLSRLSAFNAQPIAGTWTLTVFDLAASDTGTLQSWGLDMPVAVCDFVRRPPRGSPPVSP